ncbi:dihydrodipicolinate synthase family protein [Trinickia dabaoshanensis]|uniref:Dihydrodipicolinate synthase family protein n=1 Tax=Trinickia dabaoshanensis TaxID=564714 RepID=A0A2N7VHP9_9BURK|nr:dihydrodipicolinate synthase family protein [Trinickia dabaoshanensis]PMS16680.1 dihydrodipicolinate synthase family protein [Trinickia dabaoshanensis]
MQILLPAGNAELYRHTMKHAESHAAPADSSAFGRVAYAAAHVVIDPRAEYEPCSNAPAIDWDRTLAFRTNLYGLGFKVAEAMDTAQRGMGLGWPAAAELIRRSVAHARTIDGADLACGAGTDQLDDRARHSLSDVIAAYRAQFEVIDHAGGRPIMMASRALCAAARSPEDYVNVYDAVLAQSNRKVVLHWLGEAFDASLAGYWGSRDVREAMNTVLEIVRLHRANIEGIKISLLDAQYERELRARLPEGVRMYTGDDFNYGDLIAGDSTGVSHALLGIFDPIAPIAARALKALGRGDVGGYRDLIMPTQTLSRELFRAPTQYYKAGVVFLAWLNGHQEHFSMAAGMQSARSVQHLARLFREADACGVLVDPEQAVRRMKAYLSVHAGIEA